MKTIVACIVAALCVSAAFGQTTQPTSQPEAWVPTTQPDFSTPEQFMATITPELLAERGPGRERDKWLAALKGKLFRCEGVFDAAFEREAMGGHMVTMLWPVAGRPVGVIIVRDSAWVEQLRIAERGWPIVIEGIFSGATSGPRREDEPGQTHCGIVLRPSRIVSLGPK